MTPIEAINNVAKAYQDLAVVLMAVADKTIGVPVAQAMTVDADKPVEEPKKEGPETFQSMTEKSGSNLLLTMPETLKQKWILWRRWQGSRFQISFGNNMHRISASTI